MNDIIEKFLHDNESRHSDFQIQNFIIGKQGDIWAQYKQCLREIEARHKSIILDEAKENAFLNIKKTWRFRILNKIFKRKNNIVFDLSKDEQNNKKGIEEELKCLVKIATELKNKIGDITPEKRAELEAQSWKNKALKMAALDMLSTGRVSVQTLDFIFSFPEYDTIEIMSKLQIDGPAKILGIEGDNNKR